MSCSSALRRCFKRFKRGPPLRLLPLPLLLEEDELEASLASPASSSDVEFGVIGCEDNGLLPFILTAATVCSQVVLGLGAGGTVAEVAEAAAEEEAAVGAGDAVVAAAAIKAAAR